MKTKMFFGASLAGNVILICAVAFVSNKFCRLPNISPPLVRFIFTNAPAAATEAAGREKFRGLQPDTGFVTNSINAIRHNHDEYSLEIVK